MPNKPYYGRPIDIPVIGVGSQPQEEDDLTFNFDKPPGEMHTYDRPPIPEPEEVENLTVAKDTLKAILQSLQHYTAGDTAIVFDITDMDAANIDLITQVFNEGEVSVVYEADTSVQIQESVLTGVWRIRSLNETGDLLRDSIEIADIPSVVREKTFANATALDTNLDNLPVGVINTPPLIVEIAEQSEAWQVGDTPHVINLTLLPLSSEDLNFLGHRLGVGPITILSRGYGNCRIGSTSKKNVWWVKYYNSEDILILNTIEVVDVPEVAKAAPEDFVDSAKRLAEILKIYDVEIEHES